MEDLKRYIREVPDYPKPGINFYDITTLLKDPLALRMTVDRFACSARSLALLTKRGRLAIRAWARRCSGVIGLSA